MFEKLDKLDWKVLKQISEDPYRKFYLRKISKELKISPSSTKKAVDILEKNKLIKTERFGNLRIISGNTDEILFKQFKQINNLEMLKPLVDKLLPAITIGLYGSYAKGENTPESDIDMILITNKKKEVPNEYKGRTLQIKRFTPAEWDRQKKENPAYVREVTKGITLYGEPL